MAFLSLTFRARGSGSHGKSWNIKSTIYRKRTSSLAVDVNYTAGMGGY